MLEDKPRIVVRRKPRLWLLVLAGVALLGLVRSGIGLRKKFEVARYGVRTLGWVTAKSEANSGLVYYAYRAGQQTYDSSGTPAPAVSTT